MRNYNDHSEHEYLVCHTIIMLQTELEFLKTLRKLECYCTKNIVMPFLLCYLYTKIRSL